MASLKTRTTATGDRRYDVRYRTPAGDVRTRTFRARRDADRFAATVEADKLRGARGSIPTPRPKRSPISARSGRPRIQRSGKARSRPTPPTFVLASFRFSVPTPSVASPKETYRPSSISGHKHWRRGRCGASTEPSTRFSTTGLSANSSPAIRAAASSCRLREVQTDRCHHPNSLRASRRHSNPTSLPSSTSEPSSAFGGVSAPACA